MSTPTLGQPAFGQPTTDQQLRERAKAVIPGGMYGHQAAPRRRLPAVHAGRPRRQGLGRGRERVRRPDVQLRAGRARPPAPGGRGRRGRAGRAGRLPERPRPGHGGPGRADGGHRRATPTGPSSPRTAPTPPPCAARSPARRPAGARSWWPRGAYHGAAPWCTPRPAASRPEDHANLIRYTYNDLASVRAAVAEAGDDLAGILVSPFKHDAGFDSGAGRPGLRPRAARPVRREAGRADPGRRALRVPAAPGLQLGAGRRGPRPVGLEQGHRQRPGAGRRARQRRASATEPTNVFVTGSFWFAAVPMAAAIATIKALKEENAIEAMDRMGTQLRDGILDQAKSWDLAVNYTGPPAMPYLTFAGDAGHELGSVFAAQALRGGAYLHPRHNWFVSAAMTGDDLALVLEATDQAFAAVRKHARPVPEGPLTRPVTKEDPHVEHSRRTRQTRHDPPGAPTNRGGGARAGRLQAGAPAVAAVLLHVRDRVLDHLHHHRHLPELRVRPVLLGSGLHLDLAHRRRGQHGDRPGRGRARHPHPAGRLRLPVERPAGEPHLRLVRRLRRAALHGRRRRRDHARGGLAAAAQRVQRQTTRARNWCSRWRSS